LECLHCHRTASWKPANAGHAALGEGLGTEPACYECHQPDYEGSRTTPASSHSLNGFPKTCLLCHNTVAFGPGTAMRHSAAGSKPCLACHREDYDRAKASPVADHRANGFPTSCGDCHDTAGFGPGTAMRHESAAAKACHDCHRTTYESAPGHASKGYPRTCGNCHSTRSWLGANPSHAALGPDPACRRCHQADYDRARPTLTSDHAANGFPTTCGSCHATTSWGPGTAMRHELVSSKPCAACHQSRYAAAAPTLSARHQANGFPTTCQNCHNTTAFGPGTAMRHEFVGGASAACQTCHMDDYGGAVSPVNHAAQAIPASSCRACHASFTAWTAAAHNPAKCYNSATRSSHEGASCSQCHPGGNYASAVCSACHSPPGTKICD
jgi:hypothetical protein